MRKYKAIVRGNISQNEGAISKPIGRDKQNRLRMAVDTNDKIAITEYKVLESLNNFTLIECNLKTDRTHQIRVHMKDLGHPILGDLVYGKIDRNFKDINGQYMYII